MLQPEGEILSWTRKQIQQHSAYPDALRPDFLTRFLSAREKFPDLLDEQQTEDYASTNVAGGSDTTAVILRALVFNMLTNSKIFENFLADVKTVLKARKQSGDGDFDRPISWAEGLTMTYYQACIKEILRYHPATAQILPRIVPDEGVELCGKFIPGGTIIGCNAWTVHRDKKLYGSDADVFRPERWLDSPAGQVRQMENLNFTFGYGSRGCIGRNVAMLEITKFVPELFRRFDVELVDPRRYTIHASWLVVQSGLDVKIRMRDPESLLV
jgi:cytochrome P450